jgi:uncharacterized protein Yka (UPF0111/DUF47 family)
MRRSFGLLPRDESFFALFEQQATVLRECLPMLAMMREADIVDPQWAMAMQAIEQRGDQLTSSIIRKAEQTFISPLDREDILALAVAVDDVLDFIEEFTISSTLALLCSSGSPGDVDRSHRRARTSAAGASADGMGSWHDRESGEPSWGSPAG